MTSHFRILRRVVVVLCILGLVALLNGCKAPESEKQAPQGAATSEPSGPISSCGDGLCEKDEGDKCCTDCGCSDPAKICDRYAVRCIDKVILSEEAKAKIEEKYKPWPVLEVFDEVQGGEATLVFKFDCTEKGEKCVHIVYVGPDGSIVQEQKTK